MTSRKRPTNNNPNTRRWGSTGRDSSSFHSGNTDYGNNRFRDEGRQRVSYDSSDRRRGVDNDYSYRGRQNDNDSLLGVSSSILGNDSMYGSDPFTIQDQLSLRETQLAAASSLLKRQSDLIAQVGIMGMGMGNDRGSPGGYGRSRDRREFDRRDSSGIDFKRRRTDSRPRDLPARTRGRIPDTRPQRRPIRRDPPRTVKEKGTCYICKQKDHESHHCPKRIWKSLYVCHACDAKCQDEASFEAHNKEEKHVERLAEIEKMEEEEKKKIVDKMEKQEELIKAEKKRIEEKKKEEKRPYPLTREQIRKIYDEIPSFDKTSPVGEDYVTPVTGFFCKLCLKFYQKETASKTHCLSEAHYHNWKKTKVQVMKSELQKDLEKESEIRRQKREVTKAEAAAKKGAAGEEGVADKTSEGGAKEKHEANTTGDTEVNGVDQTSFDQQMESMQDEIDEEDEKEAIMDDLQNANSNIIIDEVKGDDEDVEEQGDKSITTAEEEEEALLNEDLGVWKSEQNEDGDLEEWDVADHDGDGEDHGDEAEGNEDDVADADVSEADLDESQDKTSDSENTGRRSSRRGRSGGAKSGQ